MARVQAQATAGQTDQAELTPQSKTKHFDLSNVEQYFQRYYESECKQYEQQAETLAKQAKQVRETGRTQVQRDALSLRSLSVDSVVRFNYDKDGIITSFDVDIPVTNGE